MKLTAGSAFALPDLNGVVEGARTEPIPTATLTATYYDSDDLRLARWGGTLRHRSDEGWSVKLPMPGNGDLLIRQEIRFDGPAGKPPPAAKDLITAIARSASLAPVLKLRTRRKGVRLQADDGSPLAEVVDDEVSVLAGRRVAARFREIEVEVSEKTPSSVAEAVRSRLESAGAGESDPTPKHVRALGARATARPDVEAGRLESPAQGVSAADLVRGTLSGSTARLIAHDPGVRLGVDPEEIHQTRVATRRLRADLRTFRPLLDAAWASELRAELRWLGGELGAVRDRDVLIGLMRDAAADFLETERRAAERLITVLEEERDSARERLLEAMRSDRYVSLLDRLVEASNTPVFRPNATEANAATLVALGARPWKRLRSEVRRLGDNPDDAALHRVRILTKRSRYAAEAVAPVAGKPARSFAKAAASLQDVLGRAQDASVAGAWLRSKTSRTSSAQSFVAGMLASAAAAWGRDAKEAWTGGWRRLERKKVPSWS
jgi:CHAD domain-containing protein